MKQKLIIALAMLGCVCALTACGGTETATESSAAEPVVTEAVQNAESDANSEEIVQQIIIDDVEAGAGQENGISLSE